MIEILGGVETFLLNNYRNIDRTRLQFDFLFNIPEKAFYEDELVRLGGRTYHITARKKNYRRFQRELEAVFREHASEWDAVWINVCNLANIDYLKAAKKYGIRQRVIHSHCCRNTGDFNHLREILHWWNKRHIEKYATDFWACSEDAADFFYKENVRQKVRIVHNAIHVDGMAFDPVKREQLRRYLHIDDKTFVIGNVGRLCYEKNQGFAIAVFREYLKRNPDSRLIFVGEGKDEKKLQKKVEDIRDKVIFAGFQADIQGWLSAFDFFLFPSLFEGLGIAALEAQANGLPVLASARVIPEEVRVTSGLAFYDLALKPAEWAKRIWELRGNNLRGDLKERDGSGDVREGHDFVDEQTAIKSAFRERGYDITLEARILEELFMG